MTGWLDRVARLTTLAGGGVLCAVALVVVASTSRSSPGIPMIAARPISVEISASWALWLGSLNDPAMAAKLLA